MLRQSGSPVPLRSDVQTVPVLLRCCVPFPGDLPESSESSESTPLLLNLVNLLILLYPKDHALPTLTNACTDSCVRFEPPPLQLTAGYCRETLFFDATTFFCQYRTRHRRTPYFYVSEVSVGIGFNVHEVLIRASHIKRGEVLIFVFFRALNLVVVARSGCHTPAVRPPAAAWGLKVFS